jgi:hypothetical protein
MGTTGMSHQVHPAPPAPPRCCCCCRCSWRRLVDVWSVPLVLLLQVEVVVLSIMGSSGTRTPTAAGVLLLLYLLLRFDLPPLLNLEVFGFFVVLLLLVIVLALFDWAAVSSLARLSRTIGAGTVVVLGGGGAVSCRPLTNNGCCFLPFVLDQRNMFLRLLVLLVVDLLVVVSLFEQLLVGC